MAYIQTITFTWQTSIQVTQYQYEKPTISMTAILEDGDNHKKVLKMLETEIKQEIERIKDEF